MFEFLQYDNNYGWGYLVPDENADLKNFLLDSKGLFLVELSPRSKNRQKIGKKVSENFENSNFEIPEKIKEKKLKFPAVAIFRRIHENFEKQKKISPKNSRNENENEFRKKSENELKAILDFCKKSVENFSRIDDSTFGFFDEIFVEIQT